MDEPRPKPGLDHYWDAIPLNEIVAIAQAHAEDCGAETDQQIRDCAEHAVRSSLCDCAAAEASIVHAVVEEFERLVRQPRSREIDHRKGPIMKVPALETPSELAQLVSYQAGSIVSQTLIKSKAGTVTVFAFAAGEGLSEHTAPFDALLLAVDGMATVTVGGAPHALSAGQLLRLPANVAHAVQADQEFKMMLTMVKDSAQPAG